MKTGRILAGLAARLLAALGVILIVAGLAASLWGVKTESIWSGTIPVGTGGAAVIAAMPTASSGTLDVRLEGVGRAYLLTVSGDPLMLFDALAAINIEITGRNVEPDIRAGIVYGWGVVKASQQTIQLLPTIGAVEEVEPQAGVAEAEARIKPGTSLAIVAVPLGSEIGFTLDYKVEGYSRTPEHMLIAAGTATALAGLAAYSRVSRKAAAQSKTK
ncbi:hypothetical protein [Aeropyrum camini]|uniref:Uncharacterized protein n=1 Tax=Aeropyrum camini SY1 = JCM 12091 TaxID=1198449 RepID=U3TH74_9CREN|nr:hypothetical protein [Aeropyrum camini]BAN90669.1 hypothetical protein ACAM_1200 [Aeropyrum camini SY1 = JCM 12091]